MSYAPATQLTSSNGTMSAPVLTNNKVIVAAGFALGLFRSDQALDAAYDAAVARASAARARQAKQARDNAATDAILAEFRGSRPLPNTSDPLRLADLEKRFVGGEFVLSTRTVQLEVAYSPGPSASDPKFLYVTQKQADGTLVPFEQEFYWSFDEIAGATNSAGQPNLMVVYLGQYIDLSYLWPSRS